MSRDKRLSLAALLSILAYSGEAAAFKTRYHEAITSAALPFLRPEILAAVNAANGGVDTPPPFGFSGRAGKDRFHYNDCGFEAGSREIRGAHERIRAALGARAQDADRSAAAEFGVLLHVAQDLYAHSNWADYGERRLIEDVFGGGGADARGPGEYPLLRPWQTGGGFVLVGGACSEGCEVAVDASSRRVLVSLPGAPGLKGIVVGTYDGDDDDGIPGGCHAAVDLGHWDREPQRQGGLNKDDPSRPAFAAAHELAYQQTVREWCRLLAGLRAPAPSRDFPVALTGWVTDPVAAEAVCRRPPTVPAAPSEPPVYWNVAPVRLRGETRYARAGIEVAAGARTEMRYGRFGLAGGVRLDGGFEGTDRWRWGGELGGVVAETSLLGGWFGGVRHAWRDERPNLWLVDLGYDVRPNPHKPLFNAIRFEVNVGLPIEDWAFERRALSIGVSVSWAVLVFDYPY